MKTYSVAGTSIDPQGNRKIRFANDYIDRFKTLLRNGHEEINLVDLGEQMTKAQVVAALLDHAFFQDPEDQAAIIEYANRNRETLEEDHFAHMAVKAAMKHAKERIGV